MPSNRAVLLFLATLLLPACGASRGATRVTSTVPFDTLLALATFDSAWSRIAHTHYDSAYNGVDWEQARVELRPRAASATSMLSLRAVIRDMLGRLGESHYALIPVEAAGVLDGGAAAAEAVSGDVGKDLRLIGSDVLVSSVRSDGAAARAGISTGWALLDVDGVQVAPRVAAFNQVPAEQRRVALTSLLYQLNGGLAGAAGSSVTLRLADGTGRVHERTLVREHTPGEVVKFGNLPPHIAALTHRRVDLPGGGCAGVIRFNVWMVPLVPQIDRAMDELAACDGVVIDLRGNPGGVAGMVMGVAGHFLNDTVPLGFMKLRGAQMRFKANPRRVRADGTRVQPYAGDVAILIDEMSASTSEFFAAGLQAVGRARVFGSTSAGQALPAVLVRLPNDDVLMHVLADFTGPGGLRIEGVGVRPDQPVVLRRENLLRGSDAALDAAIAWIRSSTPRTEE